MHGGFMAQDRGMPEGVRARLIAALDTGQPADEACRQELAAGAWLSSPSPGHQSASHFVGIYTRRIEHLRRKGIRFTGDDVVQRINASPYSSLRAVGVHGQDNFTVFLAPEDDEVVGTIGVDGAVANQDFEFPENDL